MRAFDAAIVTALAAETARAFWLLEMQFGATYYYTNCDVDLVSGGNTYASLAFDIGDVVQAADFSIDRLTVEIGAVDLVMSAILLNEDVANLPVILSYVMLDVAAVEIDAPEFFRGFVTAWELDARRARLTLGNEFLLWRKKTLRLPADSCPWVFKGTECAYAGAATWCDQSVERCKALSNYANFGGRRYILAIEDKQVYWAPN